MARFSAPAFADDFTPALADGWSALIDGWLTQKVQDLQDVQPASEIAFFNEQTMPVPEGQGAERAIVWDGFPLVLKKRFATIAEACTAAEQLQSVTSSLRARVGNIVLFVVENGTPKVVDFAFRNQDEYLEWHAVRDPATGRLVKLVFTAEGPEYWRYIAEGTRAFTSGELPLPEVPGDAQLLLRLYHDLVDPNIPLSDLFHARDVRVCLIWINRSIVAFSIRREAITPTTSGTRPTGSPT